MESVLSLSEVLTLIGEKYGPCCLQQHVLRRAVDRLERDGKIPVQRVKGCRVIGEQSIPVIIEDLKATGRLVAVTC